jgi:hypothetical protein
MQLRKKQNMQTRTIARKFGHKQKEIPNSSISQCRSDIFFAPYIKLPGRLRGIKFNQDVEISGKRVIIERFFTLLTQKHRDILIASLLSCEKNAFKQDGSFALLFSLRQVLKKLGINEHHQLWLTEKLKELRFAPFTVIDPEDRKKQYPFTILSELKPSKVLNKNVDGGFMKDKIYYYYAAISKEFIEFMHCDIQIYTNNHILESIIKLKNAETKSLAWYCLSQNKLNKNLEDVLRELGVFSNRASKQTKRFKLNNIKEECKNLKDEFGIEIKQMANKQLGVFYKKHKSVYFSNHKKEIKFIDFKEDQKETVFNNLIKEIK